MKQKLEFVIVQVYGSVLRTPRARMLALSWTEPPFHPADLAFQSECT